MRSTTSFFVPREAVPSIGGDADLVARSSGGGAGFSSLSFPRRRRQRR